MSKDEAPSKSISERLAACEAHLRDQHRLALAGTLIGATMHEVNNRLEALTNYIYLAQRTTNTPLESARYLDGASQELKRVGEITSRSLGFVRKDLAPKDIDLVELANAALELHREKLSTKRINVVVEMDDSVVINGKRGELLQVLVNLLLNATEALPHSGNLYVRVAARPTEAVVTIADTGSGIPKDLRSSLFQSFKSSKETGSGLGLWVVQQIVHSHKGRIRYWSSTRPPKSGTVFRIALPIREG